MEKNTVDNPANVTKETLESVAAKIVRETAEADGDSVTEDSNDTIGQQAPKRVLGCMVRPLDKANLTEADLALAWKEYNNAYTPAREVSMIAQAVDPDSGYEVYDPVTFVMTVYDLAHGGVPGRTIRFGGYLIGEIPEVPGGKGGLCPHDEIGWPTADHLWVSIIFDLYDQVGYIESYRNRAGEYKLRQIMPSSALNPEPVPPPLS